MKKWMIIVSISLLVSLMLMACGQEKITKYHVDYGKEKAFFNGAKDAYPAGEKVTLYYDNIATDSSYQFYLDGEMLQCSYYVDKGFEITFTMPNHDVSLTYTRSNNMIYVPESEDETEDGTENETEDGTENETVDEIGNDTEDGTKDEAEEVSKDGELKEYVSVSDLDAPHENIEQFDFVTVSDSEPAQSLVFETEETVTEFRILQLSLEDVDENGKPLFSYKELYLQEELTKEHPLCASVGFLGDLPNVGISYIDPAGNERFFAIEISGYDGSLIMTEF
ncbi:MAG: hypothetical protein II919_02105 [Lachnospiraceae bacterium]|nr:hypothetical protein [Lachnospiraceae bacterium]